MAPLKLVGILTGCSHPCPIAYAGSKGAALNKETRMLRRHLAIGIAALAVWAVGVAQDDAGADAPGDMVNCVSLTRVINTRIVDEQTLLFYMRGGDIYRNVLPHRCPGLDRNSTFMYRVTTSQLCSVDVVTVLEDFGSRFMPGASCGLGRFQQISEAAAEEIIRVAERDEDAD
jgi:hypothetical protein